VANDVPAPHEIDEAWLMRYDWILKRVMLDDSFLPALAYLGSEFAGQESALIILEMEVQHQKNIVDQLSRQVQLANGAIDVWNGRSSCCTFSRGSRRRTPEWRVSKEGCGMSA
jgi:hypothetical protein